MTKILVVTPRFPYPETGACEQDRAEGIRQLQRLGYETRVIGKVFDWQDKQAIGRYWQAQGVPVRLIDYRDHRLGAGGEIKKLLFGLLQPRFLDGAAFEYRDPNIIRALKDELQEFRPDLVWFDYTYLWPLYKIVKQAGLPIITRSINVEARHFLAEDGRSLKNYARSIPKFWTERITARVSDLVFSINPEEREYYKKLGAKAANLPLRALPKKLGTHTPSPTDQLQVFFSGSTYNVSHNRRALEFIIKEVATEMKRRQGHNFIFHLTGTKFPEEWRGYLSATVRLASQPTAYEEFLRKMDIALAPSFFGAGMQQKIFELLARGFPTITHARGLAGYDFAPDKEVLVADGRESFCQTLESLRSFERRQELSVNAKHKSQELFSQNILDKIVREGIELALM